jgi:excinuclease ABC subunit C
LVELSPHLSSVLESLPAKPGCYLMKDTGGAVIYVGKAVNLRSRVRSYFHASAGLSGKTEKLVPLIADIEWILVGSELEALILEMNLIKRYRPKYNVRLKDDKYYPYIKVHWADPFPKVTITRSMVRDGSRYFGPYTSAWAVHQTLDLLRKVFPFLTCDRVITGKDTRACLWYDLKLCTAPCIGAVSEEEYRRMIDNLCRFLQGESEPIVGQLEEEMRQASADLRYEKAAALRDQLQAIHRIMEKQKIVSTERADSDVIALARQDGDACVQVFFIRGGRLIGREYFVLEGTRETEEAEVLRQFLLQYYAEAASIPPEVLLPTEIEEGRIIEDWLRSRHGGGAVSLVVPRGGEERGLLDMAAENAAETLRSLRAQWESDHSKHVEALADLQRDLGLPAPPVRIECYDISNIQGTAVVASMVVFEQGAPRKAHYRRFRIRTVADQPDDFASMHEVLSRRFSRFQTMQTVEVGKKKDPSFSVLPDLLLIDGGKGQLAEAEKVLAETGLAGRVPVASLAKQHEEIFRPGQPKPVLLSRDSQALRLLQRVRDEAHRFAVSYHRDVRTRIGLASRLETIEGIGPARRKALLIKFGSPDGIRQAGVDELMQVRGITRELAVRLKEPW